MLDKVLIKHLDDQEEIEDAIDKDIEKLIMEININQLMADSKNVLVDLVSIIFDKIKNEYYNKVTENGIKLARDIVKDGDIQIPKTNDPNLNENA